MSDVKPERKKNIKVVVSVGNRFVTKLLFNSFAFEVSQITVYMKIMEPLTLLFYFIIKRNSGVRLVYCLSSPQNKKEGLACGCAFSYLCTS